MKVKNVVLVSCMTGFSFLYGCDKPAALEEAVANYEVEPIMTEEELAAIDWSGEILPYMEYDWLSDENIEPYYDTSWIMQLADLNLDGQQEMLVTLPIYNGEDLTYIYTVEDETVVYCGKIIAGTAYNDNASFITDESYLPSNYIEVYQNESGEFRYLSGNDYLKGDHGYYQIYESTFEEKSISCEPIFAIGFATESDGTVDYSYVTGDFLEQESEEEDDSAYSAFTQAMEEYMEGYEKADITFTESEFRVPGIVNELPEEKKEMVRNNIKAGFAKALPDADSAENNEEYEDVAGLFDAVTIEMLDACNEIPSVEAYNNDSLVLLNWYSDDVRLYGISVGEENAMLLYVQGEKVLIDHPYRNMHISYPKLNVCDADSDGVEEIAISRETLTGSPGHWYELLVVDYEDAWVVHDYDSYVEDIEAIIDYEYDKETNTVTFLSKEDGAVLTEVPLPEWTDENPYQNEVDFADYIRFDAETMKMEVEPGILLENSLPYISIQIIFDVSYQNGEFELKINSVKEVS